MGRVDYWAPSKVLTENVGSKICSCSFTSTHFMKLGLNVSSEYSTNPGSQRTVGNA
ncbi:MAG: hypothetical protein IPG53_14735 [Ignavibacteriales bacterium]|nr:hypothetical protein [Ignavibacteriales bacterium]